ncbi:hypothetical protein GUITHDRAFT_112098 [Guillardia theta CCMP2712]|uniref:Transcription factor Iwr1 domain-containing protein n=1 Tax=Guillardia theta (strain CCMP2712) TaxID=905079 RepID=L1J0D8_GUITC|nr:hypothetical protein GUITHDRAFT_112098 [Guillardia theta CCMP2712]EKX41966.1 hypothetical protein GUITHDRAFT_112098 [Guillardia theta CCMP2712]|eukprot:XP_005828946.1 hypothetical protein GUITHDRAFT_112098 [Guillardia theta CCMP2712]
MLILGQPKESKKSDTSAHRSQGAQKQVSPKVKRSRWSASHPLEVLDSRISISGNHSTVRSPTKVVLRVKRRLSDEPVDEVLVSRPLKRVDKTGQAASPTRFKLAKLKRDESQERKDDEMIVMTRRDRVRKTSEAVAAGQGEEEDGDVKLVDLELTNQLKGNEWSPSLTFVDKVERARWQRMGEIQEALEKEEGYAYDLYFLDDKPPDPEQLEQGKSKVVTLPMDFNFEEEEPSSFNEVQDSELDFDSQNMVEDQDYPDKDEDEDEHDDGKEEEEDVFFGNSDFY